MAWNNADGLIVRFGSDWAQKAVNQARALSTMGAHKVLELDIDLTKITAGTPTYTSDLDNDGVVDGFNSGDTYLPNYASVTSVVLVATEAAAGGTSFTIGTYQQTGTAIAATGLVTATEGVVANVNAIGKRVFGAGSLVSTTAGTASVGALDAYIGVNVVGTFTAGKLKAYVIYLDTNADIAGS